MFLMASGLLYVFDKDHLTSGGYKNKMMRMVIELLSSNVFTYWLAKSVLAFVCVYSVYKIILLLTKKSKNDRPR